MDRGDFFNGLVNASLDKMLLIAYTVDSMKKKKEMTVRELGIKAGNSTYAKYGREHYVRMAQIRWAKYRARRGGEEYVQTKLRENKSVFALGG